MVKLMIFIILVLVISYVALRLHAQNQAQKAVTTLTWLVQGEGCYNEDVKKNFEASLKDTYGMNVRSDTNQDGVIDDSDDYWINFYPDCTAVTNASGTSVYNDLSTSYLNHVSRGEVLHCSVTVTINYRTPFGMFMIGDPILFNETITAEADTVSTRYFKGDA